MQQNAHEAPARPSYHWPMDIEPQLQLAMGLRLLVAALLGGVIGLERERRGRFVYYRIADPRVSTLLDAGDGLLLRVGDRVYVGTRYQGGTAE